VVADFCNLANGRAHQYDGMVTEPALTKGTDLALADRCLGGDRAAQRELFQREKRRVHATLYRVLGSNSEMEDLVQEAFIEVFKSLASFRGEAKLSTWIDRVTVRVAYGHLTRKRPRAARLESVPDLPARDASAEQRVVMRQAAQRMYEVLDHLDVKLRMAFSLHVLDGRPLTEVAQLMSASLVATKTRVWRARSQRAPSPMPAASRSRRGGR
jgi:RNA polymerase sigma-70 factor (ECF subfamily)